MTRARDMANIAAGSFSIPSGSLANAVPADGSITTAKLAANAVTNAKLASGAITSGLMPAGSILQVQSATEDNDFSGTGQNIDIMTLTITPSSTSSKILVMSHSQCSAVTRYHHCKLYRKIGTGSYSQIAHGDNSSQGTRQRAWYTFGTGDQNGATYTQDNGAGFFLDTPATTSQLTYKITIGVTDGTNTTYGFSVNASHYEHFSASQNAFWNTFPITTLTAMEIAG
jgi:hypothetical protein